MRLELENEMLKAMETSANEIIEIINHSNNSDDAGKLLLELTDNMLMKHSSRAYDLLPKFIALGKGEYIVLQKTLSAKLQEYGKKIMEAVLEKVIQKK